MHLPRSFKYALQLKAWKFKSLKFIFPSLFPTSSHVSVQLLNGSTLIWRMVGLLWPVPTAGFWLLLSVRHHYISSIHPRHQIYSIDIDNTQTGSRHNTHIRCMNPNRGLFYNSIFLSKPIITFGGMMHNSISTSSFSLRPGRALYDYNYKCFLMLTAC